ncbi:MAG: hypothetical protein IJS19_08875 [Muribaculaceae bacterium]|nr:hypothetical protein [Muribaculaceae bacterium]
MNTLIKRLAIAAVVAFCGTFCYAAKPAIMLLPDDTWLEQNHFMDYVESDGGVERVPNYLDAYLKNTDLKNVTVSINSVFASNGYPLKDAEMMSKRIKERQVKDGLRTSESGARVQKSAIDMIEQANADILLYIGWEVEKLGSQQSLTFRIEAKDPYSVSNVASKNGTMVFNSYSPTAAMLEQVVLAYLPKLEEQLMEYRDRIAREGRQIALEVRVWDNAFNMATEYGGVELADIITDWVSDNTVNHQFLPSGNGEYTNIYFDEVHIPLKDKNGRPMSARQFANSLRNYLKTNFGIVSANKSSKLGNGLIYLGEK